MKIARRACLLGFWMLLLSLPALASDVPADGPAGGEAVEDAQIAGRVDSAAATGSAIDAPPLAAEQIFRLLSTATPHAERQQLFNAAGAASRGGDGRATFLIGVQFRHGKRHPSQLVKQDLDIARDWLQRCLQQTNCPYLALASLAELEFEAGRPDWALTWAIAYAHVEHHIALRNQTSRDTNAYERELVWLALQQVPARQRKQRVETLLASIKQDLGPTLRRMIDAATQPVANLAEHARRVDKPLRRDRTVRLFSGRADYLIRLAPSGGKPDGLVLIESLPQPATTAYLDQLVRTMEYMPLPADAPSPYIAIVPMVFVVPRPLPDVDFE